MSDILIFNPDSTPVANRAVRYLRSVNTPDYSDRTDVLINPVLPADIALGLLKVVGDQVVELDQADLDAIAAQQAANAAASEAARIAAAREFAKGVLDGDEGVEIFMKIMLEAIVDHLNVLRPYHSLADITPAQVKTVIVNKINAL